MKTIELYGYYGVYRDYVTLWRLKIYGDCGALRRLRNSLKTFELYGYYGSL